MLGLFFSAPAASPILGAVLYEMTGMWHLDDYLGHCCIVVSVAVVLHHTLRRLVSDDDLRRMFWRRYAWVPGLAMPGMYVCLRQSDASAHLTNNDILAIPPDTWLIAYWTVCISAVLYMLAVTGYALRIVRRDPDSRPTATAWIVAGWCGIAAGALGLVNAYTGLPLQSAVWLCFCGMTCVFAFSAVHGWRERLRPFRDLLMLTRQRATL
ncbi:hypothetical protein B5566_02720 [Mycobacterium sp. MHSD3]|nr:hypothetical protein B5566_02720 [Mycobacterium sp. MHSD3]